MRSPVQYREHLPSAALRPFVECIWTRTSAATWPPQVHRVLPDGCMDIVFDLGNSAGQGSALVVGTMSRPLLVPGNDAPRFLGVRFRPGQARLFFDCRASELTDGSAQLDAFWGRAGSEVLASIQESRTPGDSVARIERWLMRRFPRQQGNAHVDRAVAQILAAKGVVSVDSLARDAGVSRQHLAHGFADWVGASPKLFARVTRFRNLLATVPRISPPHWAAIAAHCGYFDQSHLIADFREFAGQTPQQFMRV